MFIYLYRILFIHKSFFIINLHHQFRFFKNFSLFQQVCSQNIGFSLHHHQIIPETAVVCSHTVERGWEALMIDRKCFNRPDGSAMGQYTKSYLISGERPSAYALFAYWTHLTPVTSCYIVLLLCSSSVVGEGEQRKYKTV